MALDPLEATVYNSNGTHYNFLYQPSDDDFRRMGLALTAANLALADGDNPVGALLTTPYGEYIAETREHRDYDSEAHAEKIVYRLARQGAPKPKPGDEPFGLRLDQCILYSTAELCVGCSHLYDQVGIGMVFIASDRNDSPGFFRKKTITQETIWRQSPRTLTVVKGLRKIEAIQLLTSDNKLHE
jgi:tRNA(Arg) A34 adenosine deaminase TadA